MPALTNSSTGEIALIVNMGAWSPDSTTSAEYVEPTATGCVYASLEAFSAAEGPTRIIDLPTGRWTINTATKALGEMLGEGWELDPSQLMAPADEVVVNPLPTWVQPTGAQDAYPLDAWVTHNGYDYTSLLEANVWEPSPQSTFWRISPDPGPLQWAQPTGSADAYDVGDEVFHEVEGRTEKYWRSNIPANTTEPGTDGTFDRWWAPIDKPGGEVTEWVQPVPGTANAPYEIEAQVTHNGKAWINTVQLNVWEPGVFGWDEAVPTQTRARDANGKFIADDPATPDVNEAWE